MFFIYFLINELKDKTYIGFTDDIKRRMAEHSNQKTKSIKGFGCFKCFVIENVGDYKQARIREKYWKSCAGRKKLKKLFIIV